MRRWSLLLVALAAVAGGCRGGKAEHAAGGAPRGGTLRIGVAVPGDPLATLDAARIEFSPGVTELLTCCLTRTLLNYRTGTTEEGGAVLRPDLAAALPEVADDGLTYTFRLKPGLRYAPPYERVSIKAQDVVRAIEHALRVGPPGPLVEIEGAQQFRGRNAGRVSGLETPDDRTLVVVRTFSKTWSMAAARLGYLVGPAAVVQTLEKVLLPYHLDAMKQAAGRLALRFGAEMEARVAQIVEERGRLAAALAELPVETWPSGANFILFRPQARAGDDVWQALLDRSVLVRNCVDWPGVEGCLRVTVGTPAENDAFLAALTEALA